DGPDRVGHALRAGLLRRGPRRLRPGDGPGGARRLPVHPGHLPGHVHLPGLDDAAVRRLRDRSGVQRPLPGADRARHHRSQRRLRPAHPDGDGLRRTAGRRRGGQGRGGHRLPGRHAGAVRLHPAGAGVDVDDHQRPGGGAAAALPAGRGGAGRRPRVPHRHHPERRAEGVHRPRHLHLPAQAVAAAGQRHLRLLRRAPAALEHHLHLGLPHGRGGGHAGAGGRLHPHRRHRLRGGGAGGGAGRGRFRAPAVVLLRLPDHGLGGGGEVPGGAADLGVGDAGALRRPGPEVDDAALPHPDRRRAAHRAAAGGEPGPGHRPGAGRGAGRHPVAAHQLLRRGAGPAQRQGGPAGAADPAGAGPRDRPDQDRRPLRRLLRGGVADRRPGGGDPAADGRGRRPGRSRPGHRGGLPEAGDRAVGLRHRAADRLGRAGGGGSEPLRRRRGRALRAAPGGPSDRGRPGRAAGPAARRAGRVGGGRGAEAAAARRRGHGERAGPDEARAGRPGHRRL
ncbi:MAG: Methylmalonyl-CoA mutase, partial [uncultured Friedmanniella sp.]